MAVTVTVTVIVVVVVAAACSAGLAAGCQKSKRAGGGGSGSGSGSGSGTRATASPSVSPSAGKGGVPPGAPSESRPVAQECSHERGPGDRVPDPDSPDGCKADADCKDGINGRCNVHFGGHGMQFNSCDYDRCFADADCKNDGVCVCGSKANSCMEPGNCRVDADCGPGGFCTPSWGADAEGACFGYSAYFCRTPRDTCVKDDDCQSQDRDKGWGSTCSFDPTAGHWRCLQNRLCPVG